MATALAIDDGYVTDEPDIYGSVNYYGAGVTLGGPAVGLVNHAWLQFEPPFSQGDLICSAWLDLYAFDFAPSTPGTFNTSPVLIRAFDEDAATAPTSYADFNGRSKTAAEVLAVLPASATGDLSSVNVRAILQELSDRGGFDGTSLVFAIESDDTSNDFTTFASIEGGYTAVLRVETEVAQWLHYTAPRRVFDYHSRQRRMEYAAPARNLDYSAPER